MNYKTLILIDNSLSMGEGNVAIAKAISKYIVENSAEGDEVSIGTFGENIEYITDYGASLTDVYEGLGGINIYNRNTYVTDTVMQVLSEWKSEDLACRSLVIITDGGEAESPLHANEELYHFINDIEYPVYCVGCMKEGTSAGKNISAISSISGGDAFYTEYEGSEASVEVRIGDAILVAINENKSFDNTVEDISQDSGVYYNGEVYPEEVYGDMYGDINNGEGDALESDIYGGEAYADLPSEYNPDDIYNSETYDSGIYEAENPMSMANADISSRNILLILIPAILIIMIAIIIIIAAVRRRNNENLYDYDENLRPNEKYCNKSDNDSYYRRNDETSSDIEHYTRALSSSDGETRLLSQSAMSHDITLEDTSDPTRLFRTSCLGSIIVGRAGNTCDVVIDYDDSVSGRHCEIMNSSDSWYVRDLGSLNGTKVNHRKVFQEMEVHNGDLLELGRLSLILSIK